MRKRTLGRTGLVVGEIGIGLRGLAFHPLDRSGARDALVYALGRGVDLVDVWRGPAGEDLVADAIRDARARDRAVAITHVAPAEVPFAVNADTLLARVYAADHVQRRVEELLRATRLEVLTIAVLDGWFDAWLDDDAWPELRGRMEQLVQGGKVLHWGVSCGPGAPAELVRAVAEPVFAVAIGPYHVHERRLEALFPAARETKAAVIGGAPLDVGGLAGELGPSPTAKFHVDDPRISYFTPARLAEAAVRVARLAEHTSTPPAAASASDAAKEALEGALARRGPDVEASTVVELALRFALSPPEIGAVLVGARSRAHVDAAVAVADGRPLSPALLARL
jgi:aryl-alcohol dehydrogenase-like predicted oxidoreductase